MRKLSLSLLPLLSLAGALPAFAEPGAPAAQVAVEVPSPAVVGWYIAPTIGFTTMNGTYGDMAGLRSAVMLNQRVGVGVAGNLVGTRYSRISEDRVRDVGGYGG